MSTQAHTVRAVLEGFQTSNAWPKATGDDDAYVRAVKRLGKYFNSYSAHKVTADSLADYIDDATDKGLRLAQAQLDCGLLMQAVQATIKIPFPSMADVKDLQRQRRVAVAPKKDPAREFGVEVTVNPGDWGVRFFTVKALASDADNRDINPRRAREMCDVMDTLAATTTIILARIPEKPDAYAVIDGQHRIYGASSRNVPTTFRAEIRDIDQFTQSPAEQVAGQNLGPPFRTKDHFKSRLGESWWPTVFERYGLILPVVRNGKNPLCWTSVVTGFEIAHQGGNTQYSTSSKLLTETFTTNEPSMLAKIEECAETIVWWKPGVNAAMLRETPVPVLGSAMGVAFALRLRQENMGNPNLDKIPHKIAGWEHLPMTRGLTAARGKQLWAALLKAANRQLVKNRFSLKGVDER